MVGYLKVGKRAPRSRTGASDLGHARLDVPVKLKHAFPSSAANTQGKKKMAAMDLEGSRGKENWAPWIHGHNHKAGE
jgi:hypothetical protein